MGRIVLLDLEGDSSKSQCSASKYSMLFLSAQYMQCKLSDARMAWSAAQFLPTGSTIRVSEVIQP